MKNQHDKVNAIFGAKMAAAYDNRPEIWQAGRKSLLGFMSVVLSGLPERAHVLCVGAGTGSEVLSLAEAFPGWRFTIIEPASAMMAVCRERIESGGLAGRCTFHEGFIDSLPASEPYDAATCLLVSHFILDPAARSAFFAGIAALLRPGGILISSDLAADTGSETYLGLLDTFIRSMAPQLSQEEVEERRARYDDIAMIPTQDVEAILVNGGFTRPTLFFQNFLIHGWYSRR